MTPCPPNSNVFVQEAVLPKEQEVGSVKAFESCFVGLSHWRLFFRINHKFEPQVKYSKLLLYVYSMCNSGTASFVFVEQWTERSSQKSRILHDFKPSRNDNNYNQQQKTA